MIHLWWWLQHITGVDAPGSQAYNFWSGFAGDLFIFGAIAAFYKKHNCHVSSCWRIAKHPVEGTPYIVCRKHHPSIPRRTTLEHIHKVAK